MRTLRPVFLLAVACGLLVSAAPQDVSAQPRLVLGAGLSNPVGDMGDAVDAGYHGRVAVQLGVPVFPVSLRAEGAVHRFNAAGTTGGSMNQLNGALSGVLSLGGIGIGPYIFGGIGKYRQSYSDEFGLPDPETRNGYHAGFGVNVGLLGVGGFAEARIVSVDVSTGNARYFPVTVGVRF